MSPDKFIDNIIELLLQDPTCEMDDYERNYMNCELREYLQELAEKKGCISHGIICALERYLNK